MNMPSDRDNRRILVVDDSENIHQDFRKILGAQSQSAASLSEIEAAVFGEALCARENFEVDSAYQGKDALALVERAVKQGRPYAMAFVDMRMPPGWDGVETIERLWKIDPQLQIAVCTAYSDYSWDAMSERLDLGDRLLILKKPFDNIEAYQMANALTAKWRMTQQATLKISSLESAVQQRTRDLKATNAALQAQIVERKLLESQLLLAQKLESIGQLAAGIAHEINTPIQYVSDSVDFLRSGFADLRTLLDHYRQALESTTAGTIAAQARAAAKEAEQTADLEFLNAEVPRALSRAADGLDRVTHIVRAMKEFAHPDAEQHGPADINHALESTLTVARNEYKFIATVATDWSDLPPIVCNIGELNQVFLNLIVNAAHAIREAGKDVNAGRISVRSAVVDGYVEISIGDNGCGIPAAHAEKIFDPFFTTKPVGQGTGQGLAIAYAIVVTKHRGSLTFQSEPGRGTTFFVRLPAQHDGAISERFLAERTA